MPSFIDEKGHCTNAVNEIVDVVIYDIKNNGFILLSDEIKFMEKNRDNKVKNKEMAVAGAGLMLLEDPNFVLGTNREIKSQPEDGYILPLNLKVKIGDKEYPISTAIKVSDKLRDVAKSSGRYQWSDDDLSIFWATEEEVSKAIARGATKNPRRLLNGESILIEVLAAFAAIPYAANNVQVGNVQVGIVRDEKFVKNREPIFKNVDLSTLDKAMAFIKELEAQKAASEIKGQQSPILAYTNEDGRINNFSIARACDTRSFARIKRDIEKNYPNYKFDRFEVIAGTEEKKPKKIAEQEKNRVFVSSNEPGTVFEAEVVRVQNSKVIIQVGDIQGIVKKEDTNWNEIDGLEDLLFEGETINVVYVKYENGKLFFSLKLLNEKPYEDNLYDLSLKDLLKYAGHDSNVFIGQAKQYHYGLFIENLYSTSNKQKGKLLIDPIFGYNLRAIVPNANFNVEENKYYKVELNLVPKNKRLERNQLFQFAAINIEETENPYKADVDLTFAKSTSPRDCAALAHTLAEVGKNMYSSKDRMFFELIQNADDAAAQKGVFVNVKTQGDFLIVRHNGNSFDKDDFDAITSSANGTKKANENKTGYKGIGFKSVFTDSEMVLIKTGGYQFKFDKNYPLFTNFEEFYFRVNCYTTEQQKRDFLQKFSSERDKFRGVSDIPWQLEPIWIDDYPTELGEEFTQSNVAIALKLGESKILGDNGYGKAIADIISNPRFMLFLRNTKRIDFNGLSVSKNTKDGIITLKNSFGTSRIEYFKREDFEIDVNNELFEKYDIDVRIVVEEKDLNSGKIIEAKFVDTHNNELENIPKKIAINNSTTLSFAILIDENGITKPNTKCNEISMFAFLPTLVKDFKFPFYINANFILDPPRQRILGDNPWNFYLMQEIARHLVKWCASLNERQDKNALNVLLSEYFEEDSADTKQLAEYFNSAYKSALESEAFILNHKGKLAKQNEIIIDKTGLSKIVGFDLFCHLLQTEKCLPSEKIYSKILEKVIFEHIKTLEFDDVIKTITNNSDFNDWFVSATDEQKKALYKWIEYNNIKTREDKLKSFVSNLPLFQFAEDYKSCEEIGSSEYIITTEHIEPIKGILSKLGFVCSDNLFNESHPLYEYIELPLDEVLFKLIKESEFSGLSAVERKMLFFALADFDGVGDAKLKKEIALFKNMNGEYKPLSEMVVNNIKYPIWLNDYIIAKEEYTQCLDKYMISDEHVFQEIVQTHYSDLEYSSVLELYNHFRDQWTSSFTKILIDRYGTTDDMLAIVERTDGAKHYFIEKYGRINLDNSITADSIEYKLIRLALSSDYDVNKLKRLIFIDNRNITEFTVAPDVSITLDKEYLFPVSEILPNQSENYTTFNLMKDLLSDIIGSDSLFSLTRMKNADVRNQLKELSTPAQYAFYVCYNIANSYRYPISITDEQFVTNVLDYFFEKKIDVLGKYIQYFTNQKIIGRFINSNDYTLESERLSDTIRQWANNEGKEKFLIALGAKGNLLDEIKRRKAFLNDEPISLSYSNSISNEITAFLNWCITLETPFTKDNQVKVLKEMFSRLNIKTGYYNNDYQDIEEWNNQRYKEFVRNKLSIYCVKNEMPKRGVYKDVHLFTEYIGDYVYLQTNRLYVNVKDKNVETVLMSVCDDRTIPLFTKEDWTKLFMVSVETLKEKEDEIIEKDNRINSLEEEIHTKDKEIEDLRAKLKAYENDEIKNHEDGTGMQQEKHDTPTIEVGKSGGIGNKQQWEAQLEAQRRLMQDFPQWTFPSNYGEADDNGKPYNFSTIEIEDENDNTIPIVLKSYKKTSEPFKINTEEWDYLIRERAVLLIYTGTDIKRVYVRDLIRKQSSIAITFSTENLDIEDKVNAFADSLHYFNELHFDFDSFNISSRVQSAAELYKKNKRAFFANDNTEDDI